MDKRIEEIKSKHQDLDSVDIANLKSIQNDLNLLEKYQRLDAEECLKKVKDKKR